VVSEAAMTVYNSNYVIRTRRGAYLLAFLLFTLASVLVFVKVAYRPGDPWIARAGYLFLPVTLTNMILRRLEKLELQQAGAPPTELMEFLFHLSMLVSAFGYLAVMVFI
jgi:hypothetical protein